MTVEFLREIKGVPHDDTILAYARENLVRVPGSDEPLFVRVLDPVLLLAGKIRNAVDIDQDLPEKPRQDVKHVSMLSLCVPHFLDDVRTRVADEVDQKQILIDYVCTLASLKNTFSGRQFEAKYPSVIRWPELIPRSIPRTMFDSHVQTALHQLGQQAKLEE